MNQKEVQIAFAFPNPGDISALFHYSVLGMTLYETAKKRLPMEQESDQIIDNSHLGSFLNQPPSCYVSIGRSKICHDLANSPSLDTHILMIDPDISFQPNILDLITVHLTSFQEIDILAGRVNIANGYPVFYKIEYGALVQQIQPFYGVKEFDSVGTGIIVLSRKMIEALSIKYNNFSFFMHQYYSNREHGDDHSFCKLARENGYKIFGAWAITGTHHKVLPIISKYPETIDQVAPGFGSPK